MRNHPVFTKNDQGSAIITALIVTVALSLAGTAAINTSNIEVTVASNNLKIKNNFYDAESAAIEVSKRLEETEPEELESDTPPKWLKGEGSPDLKNPSNWDFNQDDISSSLPDSYYSVTNRGIAKGSSLSMVGSSRLHAYAVYGLSKDNQVVKNLIEVGYKRRY